MTDRQRILLISPYPPVDDPTHGSARVISGLAPALAKRHDLWLVHPRASGPPSASFHSLASGVIPYGPDTTTNRNQGLRDGLGILRGRPVQTSGLAPAALRRTVDEVILRHQPTVVQVEGAALGAALLASTSALRIVSIYDPARD